MAMSLTSAVTPPRQATMGPMAISSGLNSRTQTRKGATTWDQSRPNLTTTAGANMGTNGFGLANTAVGSLSTPQLSNVLGGRKGFTPGEIVNMEREAENQNRSIDTQRRQQALDLQSATQGNVRGLYGQAQAASDQIGTQAYNRINQDLQNNLGESSQRLTNRGLGNTTIVDTVNRGYQRDAADSRQGIDEQRAQQKMGLLQNLAGTETGYANNSGTILTGQQFNAPNSAANYGAAKQNNSFFGKLGNAFTGAIGGALGQSAGKAIGAGASGLLGMFGL